MRSFLLEQMARLLVPMAVLFALALLLKGHNDPGGGFVAGLTVAFAGILDVAAFGTRVFRRGFRLDPARLAVAGFGLMLLTLVGPLAFGLPMLTHLQGDLPLPWGSWHWHTALLFDLGVMLAVGGGGAAAAVWLWEERAP